MKIALAGQGAFGVKHLEAVSRIEGIQVVTYGISVNKKMIAGKIANMKLYATLLARFKISSSCRFLMKSFTSLYNDTLSQRLNLIFRIQ